MRIVIPIYDRFTALDAVGPYEVLSRIPGAKVVIAATAAGPVRTDTGQLALVADAALADVDGYDVLVVPGGAGSRDAAADTALLDWIRSGHAGAMWTTSVCTGSDILGATGLLEGLRATTHWSASGRLEACGAIYAGSRYVVQDRIITAAGVSAGIDMALALVALIAGEEMARAIQLGIEYDPQPPFDSGSVAKASPEIVDLLRGVFASGAA